MSTTGWPADGDAILDEARRHPGRLVLLTGSDGVLAERFAEVVDCAPAHVGRSLLAGAPPTTAAEVVERISDLAPAILVGLDALFWGPWLQLDPLSVLRSVASRRPGTLSQWPGRIVDGRALYSDPGRPDWYDSHLRDAVVLAPVDTTFPDDLPYRTERFP